MKNDEKVFYHKEYHGIFLDSGETITNVQLLEIIKQTIDEFGEIPVDIIFDAGCARGIISDIIYKSNENILIMGEI